MRAGPDLPGNTHDEQTGTRDWRGVGEMITLTTEQLAAPVEGMHMAILDRWFGLAGSRVEPARRLVGGLTASVYKMVRLGGSAVGSAISIASEQANANGNLRPIWETRRGRYVQSIFNSVLGDRLEDEQSPLRIELSLRDLDGSPISTSETSLGRAFPNPTGRLVVLLHGLGETERCWQSDDHSTVAEAMEADGFSVLRPRYNTGRSVEDNGSALADLLDSVKMAWPVPVDEIVLIGHSMGGLVAQSAVRAAYSSGQGWADLATHLVAIGTPHRGSPIEKGVEGLSRGLGLFQETRPIAAFLEGRSAGIKDLRHGVDNRPQDVRYHAIAGAVTIEPTNPFGRLVGDLVVGVNSALGSSPNDRAVPSDVLVVGGRRHTDLLHDERVTSQIRQWLGS